MSSRPTYLHSKILAQKKEKENGEQERERKREGEGESFIVVGCCSEAPSFGLAVVVRHLHWDWLLN